MSCNSSWPVALVAVRPRADVDHESLKQSLVRTILRINEGVKASSLFQLDWFVLYSSEILGISMFGYQHSQIVLTDIFANEHYS